MDLFYKNIYKLKIYRPILYDVENKFFILKKIFWGAEKTQLVNKASS